MRSRTDSERYVPITSGGLPKNLTILHSRFLTPIAILYWAHAMRTPFGELAFAAHARHADGEMRALAHDVLLRVASDERTKDLQRLLAPMES